MCSTRVDAMVLARIRELKVARSSHAVRNAKRRSSRRRRKRKAQRKARRGKRK